MLLSWTSAASSNTTPTVASSYLLRVSPDAIVATGTTTAADFDLQMKLSAAYLTDPGYRDVGFDGLRKAGLEN